ncbi:alpha,alpha-trehalase [Cyclonatronum proteinivorum]|uniref:Alpha,alpha-trehalase n=1 Tax=Cyclonatronum proteinivorum TaxID=1457365 RepID=A0A345UL96_9BACT|nr:alpha,alpha-trehalase TreF [Cyclonatronum proteinivorum]AXJ01248.1 alpha,alpha-trehalase [Cyclonatronum proteinivorum]
MKAPKLPQTSGALFEAVQKNRVFPDSKYFVDCTPKSGPAEIQAAWEREKDAPDFDLKTFVEQHFEAPDAGEDTEIPASQSCREHVRKLWPLLFRRSDGQKNAHSSLLPLPHPYVVPGGRFREIYYWDSYFTALGLAADGHAEMTLNMTRNFAHLIETVGHVPNGNRTYYLSRSQPPFFAFMVDLCVSLSDDGSPAEFLPALLKEHAFWMDETGDDNRRTVKLPSGEILNRYWDDHPAPREESWFEDDELAHELDSEARQKLFRNIRAACESGWDFTSRWFANGKSLSTIETTDILPADLNALLWFMEHKLAEWLRDYPVDGTPPASHFAKLAEQRKATMNRLMWDAKTGMFRDYNFVKAAQTGVISLAAVYPLFTGLATEAQAKSTAEGLEAHFLMEGGLATTPVVTGQQWDAPNGWAPLQWMAIQGLHRYGHDELADTVTRRWLEANERIFERAGKMVEKYNVADSSGQAGGGEYPLQDGFGWSNGVFAALYDALNRG